MNSPYMQSQFVLATILVVTLSTLELNIIMDNTDVPLEVILPPCLVVALSTGHVFDNVLDLLDNVILDLFMDNCNMPL